MEVEIGAEDEVLSLGIVWDLVVCSEIKRVREIKADTGVTEHHVVV